MKEQQEWTSINQDRQMVDLLKLIRAIDQNKDETMHNVMLAVECDLDLFLTFQQDHQSLD